MTEKSHYPPYFSMDITQLTDWETHKKFLIISNKCKTTSIPSILLQKFRNILESEVDVLKG